MPSTKRTVQWTPVSLNLKLIITKQVEDSINEVLRAAVNQEWSGLIFFKKVDEGFIIEDYSVDDFGNHTFTDFELTGEQNQAIFANRMEGRFWGMLHSH